MYLNRDHTPLRGGQDARATRGLQMTGVVTQTFDDLMLVSPQAMVDSDGRPLRHSTISAGRGSSGWRWNPSRRGGRGTFVSAGAPESIDDWADSLSSTVE